MCRRLLDRRVLVYGSPCFGQALDCGQVRHR
jgi:hypothetical protein